MEAKEQSKKPVRYPGIVEHARRLGVTRPHLWMVLEGKRESRRLRRRYAQLTGRMV